MKVSIITPSFNQGQFIEKTIRSVLCQDYPDLEYIVVDGLSQDQTETILDRYQDFITHIICEADKGQSDALNKGFALATGDVLAYLNSDDLYANPHVISRIVHHFQESHADVVYGQRYLISGQGHLLEMYPYRSFNRDIFVRCDFIPQECVFWTRSIFEKSGAFISRDFDFAMDYELWFRFLEQGATFHAVPDPVALFRQHAQQKTIAQWQQKGLPEIARLHQKYNDLDISEQVMFDLFWEHFYGVNPAIDRSAYDAYDKRWKKITNFQIQMLERSPLDEWVYHQPIHAQNSIQDIL